MSSCCYVVVTNPSSSQDNKTFQQLPEQIIEAGADGDYEFIRLCVLVMMGVWMVLSCSFPTGT